MADQITDYCGSIYEVAEIEALYAEKEAAAVEASAKTEEKAARETEWEPLSGTDWGANASNMRTEAGQYITQGGVQINQRDGRFTHTTKTRTKIEKSSSSSGGTTVDRQSFSGKSGKFQRNRGRN